MAGRLRNKYQQIYVEIGKSYGVPVYGQQIVNTIRQFYTPILRPLIFL